MAQFAVVEFTASQTVEVVPMKWLSAEEDLCYWPPFKSGKVAQLVKEQQEANNAWKQHAVRILGKAVSYERAREKLSMAEDTSDINSDCDRKRKRRAARRYLSYDSCSDDEPAEMTRPFVVPSPPPSLVAEQPPKKRSTQEDLCCMLSCMVLVN